MPKFRFCFHSKSPFVLVRRLPLQRQAACDLSSSPVARFPRVGDSLSDVDFRCCLAALVRAKARGWQVARVNGKYISPCNLCGDDSDLRQWIAYPFHLLAFRMVRLPSAFGVTVTVSRSLYPKSANHRPRTRINGTKVLGALPDLRHSAMIFAVCGLPAATGSAFCVAAHENKSCMAISLYRLPFTVHCSLELPQTHKVPGSCSCPHLAPFSASAKHAGQISRQSSRRASSCACARRSARDTRSAAPDEQSKANAI